MAQQDNKLALSMTELVVDVVQLLGRIGVFTATLMTTTIGLMVTGIGAIAGVLSMIISINSWLDSLDEFKKGRDTCYGMYRRIRSLVEFTNPNDICYKHFSTLTNWTKNTLLAMREFLYQRQSDLQMTKKILIPAEFNSFILHQNILSWLDLNEAIITAQEGAYCDYIEFVSIKEYIQKYEIFQKDKARLEMLILNNDVDILTTFLFALESLYKELVDRKTKQITDWTLNDIDYCLENVRLLLSIYKENGELYDNLKTQIIPQSKDVASLMFSIFRYLDYGYGLNICGYAQLSSLYSDDELLSGMPIDNYVANDFGKEWILDLIKEYTVDYGIMLFNNVYIKKYQIEIEKTFNKNKEFYDEDLYNNITDYIDRFEKLGFDFYSYSFIYQVLQYFKNKSYTDINRQMITYIGLDNDGYKKKTPNIQTYVTFNYKNIYEYLEGLKSLNLYNEYFVMSKMFNDKEVYSLDLCSAWLEDNTYHFDTGLAWRDKGYMQKYQYSFKELLDYPYTTEERFEQILKSRELFAVLFVNAFQKQNTRYYCGYLRDLANILFNNGFNYDKLDDNNAIIDMIIRSKKLFEVRYINGIISNSNYKSVVLAFVNNTLSKYQKQNYTFKSFSNRYTGIDCYKILEQKGLKQILWESYLETYGKYGFDIVNAKREQLFNQFLDEDIELVDKYILNGIKAETVNFEIKYDNFLSIFKQQTVTKYNLEIFELFKKALELLKSNFGKYQNNVLLKPYYIYKDNILYFNGFIQPFNILEQSYYRTNGISDLFYILNQVNFETLFSYSEGNFYSTLLEINQAVQIKPENYELIAKFEEIEENLKASMYSKTKNISKEVLFEEIANSFKQEAIEKEIYENEKYIKENSPIIEQAEPEQPQAEATQSLTQEQVEPEQPQAEPEQPQVEATQSLIQDISVSDKLLEDKEQQIQNNTEKIANAYQEQISQQNLIVDKKLLKKYTIYGLLGLGILKSLIKKR